MLHICSTNIAALGLKKRGRAGKWRARHPSSHEGTQRHSKEAARCVIITRSPAGQLRAFVEGIPVDVLRAAMSGFIGTIAMVAVIYVFPLLLRNRPLNIPIFVGSLLSSRPRVAGFLGTCILPFNGSVIACLGRLVWRFGTGAQGLLEGLGFGTLLGMLSIAVMKAMLAVHPKATGTPVSQPLVAFTLWVGHLAYGGCVALVFAAT